jgi:hypothetical protein
MDWKRLDLACVAILDAQGLSTYDNSKPVIQVSVPGQGLARLQNVPADNQVRSLGDCLRFHWFLLFALQDPKAILIP